jgi:MFS family permease
MRQTADGATDHPLRFRSGDLANPAHTVAPPAGRLHARRDQQWIITAYTLAFASLLLVGGRIGDRFGHKPTKAA